MSWMQALQEVKPEVIRGLINNVGLALVLGAISWLLWGEYKQQMTGRFDAMAAVQSEQRARIEYLEAEALHIREFQIEEQKQRRDLLASISEHLRRLDARK